MQSRKLLIMFGRANFVDPAPKFFNLFETNVNNLQINCQFQIDFWNLQVHIVILTNFSGVIIHIYITRVNNNLIFPL